ncbi:MAG: dehydrogenase [Lentisphaerae bacterium RIFOXYC12_FULL_60_16]|nr:MAG: dehydrogenase [Lentisphaerae bacterium RIFOXYC12_FULL_60_16]
MDGSVIMKAMAAILVESGKPLVLEEIEIPALRFGQVLVKVICSGICGAQINEIDAVKGPDKFLPHLFGHEATADVLECGEGVTSVKPGDRVVMHWRKGAGLQAPTPKYRSKVGVVNAGWVTTFNTHAVISENRLTPVPKDFDVESGALLGCAVTTALGVLNNDAGIRAGESLVILGTGGVGLSLVQGGVLVGAHPIVAMDVYQSKLDLARTLGATDCVCARSGDVAAAIRAVVGPGGADVVVDNTGNRQVIEMAYEITAAQGRTILVGVPRKGDKASFDTLPLHFRKVLTGSEGGGTRPEVDIPRYVRLCQAGKLDLKRLVTNRYQFEQINGAIEDLRAGKVAGRCMVAM